MAIVEVDKAERVYCAQPGCHHTVYKAIHVVKEGDKLLVLAALNLCSQQIELQQAHQEALDRYQEQVSATVDVIERTLGQV